MSLPISTTTLKVLTDALVSLPWLAGTFVVLMAAIRIRTWLELQGPTSEACLQTGVIAYAFIVLTLTCLGSAGCLSGTTIFCVPFLLGVAVLIATPKRTCGLGIFPELLKGDEWPLIPIALGFLCHVVLNGIYEHPSDWDCLMYHIPLVDEWLRSGSLFPSREERWSDPANQELFGLWFAGPFSGDFLLPAANFCTCLIFVLAVFNFCRSLGMSSVFCWLAVSHVIANRVVIRQATDLSNDLVFSSFFFSALHFGMKYSAHLRSGDLLLLGVCVGLTAGTKFLASGYAALAVVCTFVELARRHGFSRAGISTLFAILLSLPFGAFWYTRNYILAGHVFYPSGSEDLHRRIIHPAIKETTLFFNDSPLALGGYLEAISEFYGSMGFCLCASLPCLTFLVLVIAGGARDHCTRLAALTLSLIVSGTAALVFFTPMLVEDQPGTLNQLIQGYTPSRYSLCLMSSLSIILGFLLSRLWAWRSSVEILSFAWILIFCAIVRWFLCYHSSPYSKFLLPSVITIAIALWFIFRRWQPQTWAASLAICVAATMSGASWKFHHGYAEFYNQLYESTLFSRIGTFKRLLILDERPFAFSGPSRQNCIWHPICFESDLGTRRLMLENNIEWVVARIDLDNKASRYNGSCNSLLKSPDFVLFDRGGQLLLFRLRHINGS